LPRFYKSAHAGGTKCKRELGGLAPSKNEEKKKMYAIIEACGRQYKVAEGDIVFMERLEGEDTVRFDKVVLLSGESTVVGTPYVEGASVEAKILKNGKGKKIRVFKYNPKKNYRRRQGHRQPYTKVQITKIIAA
jgi:large subunit ribosomal protein L21